MRTIDEQYEVQTYRRRIGGEEDQATEICSTFVAQSTGGIDQSSDTISLNTGTDDGRTPAGGSSGSLLGLEKFLLAVGGLGAVVGVTKQRCENTNTGDLVEDDAEGDRGRLDGWEV